MTYRKIQQIAHKAWGEAMSIEEVDTLTDKELELFANEVISIITNDLGRWLWEDINEEEEDK